MTQKLFLTNTNQNLFVIDSGASSHIVCNKHCLIDPRPVQVQVSIADQNFIKTELMGTVQLDTGHEVIKLKDCLWSPKFKINLISVPKLTQANACVKFLSNTVEVMFQQRMIMHGRKHAGLYELEYKSVIKNGNDVSSVQPDNDVDKVMLTNQITKSAKLLHNQLGHPSLKTMKQMGLEFNGKLEFCIPCVKGKQTRTAFKKQMSRNEPTQILDRLHTDLCLINNQYVLGIIDEHSKYSFIKILESKQQATHELIILMKMIQTQTKTKIKSIHSDRGSEFVNTSFKQFCSSNGIQHTLTCANTPANNAVIERFWRTLLNVTRSIIFTCKSPAGFANEALECANYLIGFRPNHSLKSQTCFEVFWGYKKDISHLKVFGCNAFVTILKKDQDKSKLSARAKHAIMLGYCLQTLNGYKLWDIEAKKIIVVRDVEFDETNYSYCH